MNVYTVVYKSVDASIECGKMLVYKSTPVLAEQGVKDYVKGTYNCDIEILAIEDGDHTL